MMNPTSPSGPLVNQIEVTNSGFFPEVPGDRRGLAPAASMPSTTVSQGGTVQWMNTGSKPHKIVDASGMKLFASTLLATFGGFVQTFPAAGTYVYKDAAAGSKLMGSVSVAAEAAPPAGTVKSTFQVYWASRNAFKGFAYDVQILRPVSKSYVNWRMGQSVPQTWFVPDKGKGAYSFRARLVNKTTGKTSGWSPVASIKVS